MKEQSHKREMAAAVRGDFARLRDRGVVAMIGSNEPSVPSPVSPLDGSNESPPAAPETIDEQATPASASFVGRLFGHP